MHPLVFVRYYADMIDELRALLLRNGTLDLRIRVHPSAKRTAIKGMLSDGSIKIDLKAIAEDGEANDALVRFLAETFNVPMAHIEILSGKTSRQKLVRLSVQR